MRLAHLLRERRQYPCTSDVRWRQLEAALVDHVLREMARANAYFVRKEEQALEALDQVRASVSVLQQRVVRERTPGLSCPHPPAGGLSTWSCWSCNQ